MNLITWKLLTEYHVFKDGYRETMLCDTSCYTHVYLSTDKDEHRKVKRAQSVWKLTDALLFSRLAYVSANAREPGS